MTAWAAIDPGDGAPGSEMLAVGCSRAEYGLCEQVPGMNFRKSDGIWRAPLMWAAWVAFRVIWSSQPIRLSGGLKRWAYEQEQGIQAKYGLRSMLDAMPGWYGDTLQALDQGTPGYSLRPFQRGGAQWLFTQERAILEDPQGNGKTPQVIRAMQMRREAEGSSGWRALVVATGAACRNWKREFSHWAPEMSCEVVAGTAVKRRRALEESKADVLVIPWPDVRLHTRLARYPGQEFVKCDDHGGGTGKTRAQCEVCEKELNALEFEVIVADEAHRMKDARSKQTRAVWHLASQAACFWPVTGTPVADNVSDIWAILHGIDPKGFPARSRFLDLFAQKEYGWHQGVEILGLRPDTERAFHAIVQPHVRRIPKEIARQDWKGRLPVQFRYPEMAPAQRRVYEQLRKLMLAELDNGTTVVPDGHGAKFTRLCQMSAASIEAFDAEDRMGFTDQRVRMVLPSHKVTDLADFLQDEPDQVVVYMNSPQLLALCERRLAELKVTSVKVAGGMTPDQQDASVQAFQAGRARVCMITAAGTESITLTASDTILFLQPNPSLLATEQAIGRVDRIGQVNPVRVIYSITPGTVEQRLYDLAQEKAERADQVTRDADLMRWMLAPGEE